MFRLIRLVIFCAVAFIAGVLYERANTSAACDAVSGFSVNGLCITSEVKP